MPYPQTNVTAFNGIDVPTRADPSNWNARSEDGWARLKPGGDQFNVLATQTNVMATAANAAATAAETAAGTATQKASDAAGSASTANTKAGEAADSASAAAGSATAAATSATAAASSATALTAISTTSNTIGGGTKSFQVQAGKQFTPGVNVKAVDAGNAARAIYGTVNSYSGTGLSIDVVTFEGSGTVANWNISVTGQRGPQGPLGGGRPFTESNMTAGGTWVTDAEDFKVILQAPGSGGRARDGGSSGGYIEKTFRGVPLGTVCTYTQGAAGLGTTSTNSNGTDGGDSTFTVPGFGSITAGGGKVNASRSGGTATGGDLNIPGQVGGDPVLYEFYEQPTVRFPKKGGDGAGSMLGMGGRGRFGASANASLATGYGAGGGGGSETNQGGFLGDASAGAPGILRIIR